MAPAQGSTEKRHPLAWHSLGAICRNCRGALCGLTDKSTYAINKEIGPRRKPGPGPRSNLLDPLQSVCYQRFALDSRKWSLTAQRGLLRPWNAALWSPLNTIYTEKTND